VPERMQVNTNRILYLYNSGHTFTKIAEECNISKDTVRSRLREMGIHLKPGRKEKISNIEDAYKLYSTGITIDKLSKEIGCSISTIIQNFKKRGYERRRCGPERKITVDDNGFNILNKSSCYWAGFIAADGNVLGNQLNITLGLKDFTHLKKFKNFIKLSGSPVFVRSDRCSVRFRSKQIVSDLEKYFKIVPNKSLIIQPPNDLNIELSRHFVRGYFDGDGCFSVNLKTGNMIFEIYSGSYKMLEWILNNIKNIPINTKTTVKCKVGNTYRIGIYGNKQIKTVMDWLYEDCNTDFLDRKRIKYIGTLEEEM
jgi:intein-encoded DNA endonuclease-like protein